MDNNSSYEKIFKYEIVIAIFISFFMTLVLLESLDVDNSIKVLAIVFISSIASILWWSIVFKRPIIFPALALIFLIALFIIKNYYEILYNSFIYKMDDFINWTVRFISELTFVHDVYLSILIVLITILMSFIAFLLVIKIRKTYPLIMLGTLFYLYEWLNFIDSAMMYYGFYIFFVMVLYTVRKYKEYEYLWASQNKRVSKNMFKRVLINSIIVCMIVILFSAILPKDIEPVSWRWLDDKAQETFPWLVNWRNSQKGSSNYGMKNVFDMSFTQFQDDPKRLGGPVLNSNELVMEVKSDNSLYLRGRVKDFYTGSYWKQTENIGHRQYSKSRISFITEQQSKVDTEKITIKHKNLTTSTIFSPYIPRMIVLEDDFYYSTEEFELYTNNIILKDQPYTVSYINSDINWEIVSKSKYKQHVGDGFDKYLQLPGTITERTYRLAENITKYRNSDYDKVKAIEDYLKTVFKYTLTPPTTPYNSDFVDYFLFDLKEGYCTYYASSMAILTRCIGIPSRYVEGYRVIEKDEDGIYHVYSSNAHAWTEVYIDGYGWMTFEPTSGFSNTWLSEQKIIDENEVEEKPSSVNLSTRKRKSLEGLEDYEVAEVDIDNNKDINSAKKSLRYKSYIKTAVVFLLVSLISIIIIFVILLKRSEKYLDNNNRVIKYYSYIEKLLSKLNKKRLASETAYEYCNKFDILELSDRLNQLTYIFNKACYSNEKVTSEEANIAYSIVCEIEKYIKKNVGLLKLTIYKYIITLRKIKNI